MLIQTLIGAGISILLAWFGYRSRFLSQSGALAVVAVGTITFAADGWVWGVAPLAFVLTTNLWALYRAPEKRSLGDRYRQGTTRRVDQIVARTGWATTMVLLYALGGDAVLLMAAFCGALATSTADAWASEIGVLSKTRPRLLTRQSQVAAGTPGAVSMLGLVAASVGAWMQGLILLLTTTLRAWFDQFPRDAALAYLPAAATLGGLAGCMVDSLLGATAQGLYYCEHCDQITEERVHACGRATQQIRGWSWLNNDGVNLISTLVGAAATAGLLAWLAR